MFGPVIQGKLVRLRPPIPDEINSMVKWFEDAEVTRYIKLRHPPTIEAEKEWFERTGRDPNTVYWVIEHEGRMVGGTSIMGIDWKLGYGTTGTLIGDRSAWGKGVAREMMRLRAEYAFTQLPLRSLRSGYLEGNMASARAQKSAGYKEVGRWHAERFVDGRWIDHVMTELLRDDWEKSV